MAYEIPVFIDSTRPADADLSAYQYHWVKDTATGIALCAAVTDKPAGVLQNAPKAGESAQVMRIGISKAKCGGNVAVGDSVGTDAAAKTATKVLGTNTTHFVGGTALEAGTNANQIISVALNCMAPGRAV